jgi:hypothetical protein
LSDAGSLDTVIWWEKSVISGTVVSMDKQNQSEFAFLFCCPLLFCFVIDVTFRQALASILVKGYFVTVIASVSQRSNPLKTKRLLRQKAPRNDCNFIPKRV